MVGIGIIGAGFFGENHARAIMETPGAKLIAASRRNSRELAQFTKKFNILGYADYRELLENHDIEAVIIATPHQEHTPVAIEAASSGKHILLEKPMAANILDCDRIIDAAHQAGVKLMMGHSMHFMRSSLMARDIIESGEMGEIIYGIGTVEKKWITENRRDWHKDDPIGGGMLMTVGIHYIDLLTWLLNDTVISVRASLPTCFHKQEADDAGMIFLQYRLGATATVISTGYRTGVTEFSARLTGTKGLLQVDMFGGVRIGKNEKWRQIPRSISENTEQEALMNEWKAFTEAIATDSESPITGAYGKHIMEICLAARESSFKQKEIWI